MGFSFGYAVDARVRDATDILNYGDFSFPAIDSGGGLREGAWVAEAADLVDMGGWPVGTRLILCKEHPHPGAQLRFTDADGLRITAFITDTGHGVVPGHSAGAGTAASPTRPSRRNAHIREAKATGLRNLPCHRADANAAWLEIILAATDKVTSSKLTDFIGHRDLATCEINTFRSRVLHVAARITRAARQTRIRIDATWRWATPISQAWQRLRADLPLTPHTIRPPDPRNPPALEARPPTDTGRPAIPTTKQSDLRVDQHRIQTSPTKPHEKSRLANGNRTASLQPIFSCSGDAVHRAAGR